MITTRKLYIRKSQFDALMSGSLGFLILHANDQQRGDQYEVVSEATLGWSVVSMTPVEVKPNFEVTHVVYGKGTGLKKGYVAVQLQRIAE